MKKIDIARIDLNLLVTFDVLMRERSVTRAARVLHRTQSSVSHALARLREQLADPVMVKVDGKMEPSPRAQAMVEEVRALLHTAQRILEGTGCFDAATSSREFRVVVPDFLAGLVGEVTARVLRLGPHVSLEWKHPTDHSLTLLGEGQVDMALLPATLKKPDGVRCDPVGDLPWACALRQDHPAIGRWDAASWANGKHVMVRLGDRLHSPTEDSLRRRGIVRRFGAIVPSFAAVPALLTQSDLIATLPEVALRQMTRSAPLHILPVPVDLPPVPFGLFTSARFGQDPAVQWLRAMVEPAFDQLRTVGGRSAQ